MKILTWNCNGAFRKKFNSILNLKADICIIQECENPLETGHTEYLQFAKNHLWIGDTKNKGLGIFAGTNFKIERLHWSDQFDGQRVKHFLPCRVNNEFNILAVWTHKNNSPNFGYIGQLWKYIQVNRANLKETFIVGDFNSNKIWDEWDRWWNHSDVVTELKTLGIESLYHKLSGEVQGNESKPTLYFQKNLSKPYHIDYVFGPQPIAERTKSLEVGRPEEWLLLSDHMPLICDIDLS